MSVAFVHDDDVCRSHLQTNRIISIRSALVNLKLRLFEGVDRSRALASPFLRQLGMMVAR
jgi:hypothetical protein